MAKRKRAFILVRPHPAPGRRSTSATTVSWSTGNGSRGWVYVADNTGEERLFARGTDGSQDAPWIEAGWPYIFTLYTDKARTQPVASVRVELEQMAPPPSAVRNPKRKKSERVRIKADPNPVPASDAPGTTTISWTTADGSPGWVYVLEIDGSERLFANAARGTQEAPWITAGSAYRFTLYGDERRSRLLASIDVAMERGQVGPLHGGRPEKHREPFASVGNPRRVYRRSPATLLRFDMRAIVTDRIRAAPPLIRHCRGGSQALPFECGYLCLVHEAVNFSDGGRAYLHRWAWFDHDWRLARISPPFFFQEPSIEFAGGLARRGDELVVSYGVGDHEAWLATVAVAEVLPLLTKPLDARTEARAMHAEAARLPEPDARSSNSPAGDLETAPHQTEWWSPTFLTTVDAYDRGAPSQGLTACERLLSVDGLPPVIELQTRRNAVFYAPSLAEIAPSFRARAVKFSVPDHWTRFNPSIAADANGKLRMIVRSSNYEFLGPGRYTIHDEQKITRTTNYLLDFDTNLNIESVRTIDDLAFRIDPPPLPVTGFEDCRLISRGDEWWLSATVWDHTPGGKGQLALLRLVDATVEEVHLLSDGIARHEKNWMPVQPADGSELYFIYSCFPTVLIKFDEVSRQLENFRKLGQNQ